MDRIFFPKQDDCYSFFVESRKSLGLQNWKSLAKFTGTSRSMLDRYRNRKLCIPSDKFSVLLNIMSLDRQEYFLKNITKRQEYWGRSLGGKKAYLLNKDKFDAWRTKHAHKRAVKYDFNINMPLSKELCEFVGAIIGDGFTNKYGSSYQAQIIGDSLLDEDYYYNILKPICLDLFNITPKITKKARAMRLNIYSKKLFEMLTSRFDIPAGVKSHTVSMPREILESEEIFVNSLLRGMFNTDGGIGFDKRRIYRQPYIRINYTSASKTLIEQVSTILHNYSINHSVNRKSGSYVIQINGIKNVNKFLSKIGLSNKRHLDKLKNIFYT